MWWTSKENRMPVTTNEESRKAPGCGCGDLIDPEHSHPSHQIHHVESIVREMLLRMPDVTFSNLVVRRVPNGVCLEGRMQTHSETPDVCRLLRQVHGVQQVLNRLTVEHEQPTA